MIIDIREYRLDTVRQLLEQADLPVEDIHKADWLDLIGWRDHAIITGVAGTERCGDCLLLRSVVIEKSHRNRGLAVALIRVLHQRALESGYDKVYLLTVDADNYFRKNFDYRSIDRAQAPRNIAQSTQFSEICPDSAVLMEKKLVSG